MTAPKAVRVWLLVFFSAWMALVCLLMLPILILKFTLRLILSCWREVS